MRSGLEPRYLVEQDAAPVNDKDSPVAAVSVLARYPVLPRRLQFLIRDQRERTPSQGPAEPLVGFQAIGADGYHLGSSLSRGMMVSYSPSNEETSWVQPGVWSST